ncbi:MAG: hypothetical protein ACYC27_05700 [Armatimonadota bacterium]
MQEKIIGLYVHQHWPYNHPYAARTWTLQDWCGYAEALKELGYNTLVIWPMLEIIPEPLSESDQEYLSRISQVIDILHNKFDIKAYIVLCPNIIPRDDDALDYDFEKRHFFWCDERVDPGDADAVAEIMTRRMKICRPLADADGFVIIDSDPGSYPGSTNAEFVNLLNEHRKMFDNLRPGIEVLYWMHAGWQGYARFYQAGEFIWGTDEEFDDTLSRLSALNPEPWGLVAGQRYAERTGLMPRMRYVHASLEFEPSFPVTTIDEFDAYNQGLNSGSIGIVGYAQTHCVQLPGIFALSQGVRGLPLDDDQYIAFAEKLIPGYGKDIVEGWKSLSSKDIDRMVSSRERLAPLCDADLKTGQLGGLLFGSPERFIQDIIMQLDMRIAYESLGNSIKNGSDADRALAVFADKTEVWQKQHGYQCVWSWPDFDETLRKLGIESVDKILNELGNFGSSFDDVKKHYRDAETFTSRLLQALRQ